MKTNEVPGKVRIRRYVVILVMLDIPLLQRHQHDVIIVRRIIVSNETVLGINVFASGSKDFYKQLKSVFESCAMLE